MIAVKPLPLWFLLLAACGIGLLRHSGHAPNPLWFSVPLVWMGYGYLMQRTLARRDFLYVGFLSAFVASLLGYGWIGEAFLIDAQQFGHLRIIAVCALALILALTDVLSFSFLYKKTPSYAASVARIIVALSLGELCRRLVLGGFPWNLQAYAFADTALAQWASVMGAHTLPLCFGLLLTCWLVGIEKRRRWLTIFVPLVFLGMHYWGWQRPLPPATEYRARIMQPSIPQDMKWKAELLDNHVAKMVQLGELPGDYDVLILPENALPVDIEQYPELRRQFINFKSSSYDFIGGQVLFAPHDRRQVRNAIVTFDPQGNIDQVYAKRRLVPFGERLPLQFILEPLGLRTLFPMRVDFVAGTAQQKITLNRTGLQVVPLICFEAAFPEGRPKQRDVIINVTNDAWFGRSNGPHQHLVAARFRAIETGLPLLRAANTGISAVIDAQGYVVSSLDLLETGVVDSWVPGRYDMTWFSRFGDLIFGLWLCLWVLVLRIGLWKNVTKRL